ncbi:exosome complex component 10 homolog [Plodia interpunctella]|uniref:exosome complex component 10 homolog n=1 Tax=Plodia interpunctella TaxID=58824 RepID=UPI0023688AC5|nr:exosome component 10 [Plodia interpunctella]
MHSDLNPEAPEFYPHLASVTKGGYSTMNKTIKSSNQLPAGASHEMFKTFTNFNIVKSKLSENVVMQSNQIVITELPTVKLKVNELEYNIEKIIDVNDSLLDRVNINIDTESGVNKPDNLANTVRSVSSWNNAPIIAKIKMGSTTFIGAKNIPRPQLSFKDTIDNSESLWVPTISDKPNSIKSLALNIIYNDEGEAIGYEHPYKVELDLYHPAAEFIDPDPSPPQFPPPLGDTKLTYVDTEHQLDDLVKHLEEVKELAVDVEHHSYRTYQGITCLIQITTTEGGDFIIDVLALREHIHKLNIIFTNPKKLKIFHGAESDVVWLQRDFGVYIVGMFDTHQAARTLKMSSLALKYLLLRYCGVNADKRYQLADWRIRPLPEELIEYARMDTHYLIYIWHMMKAELLQGGDHLLLAVFEQSRQICGTTYNKKVVRDDSHMPLYVRSKKSFNTRQMSALKMLYKWRDAQARLLDESTTYLLPNHMLLSLAETLPREVQGVHACCNPMPPFVKQNLIALHRMILSCRELPVEPQLYQMPSSLRTMVTVSQHLAANYQVHDFSHHPDFSEDTRTSFDINEYIASELPMQPEVQAFKTTYKTYCGIVSDLNVDAKLFIPPYDRYRKYRSLAQMEEMKEFKDKEAKITALGKGDELIKTEVLSKLQLAKAKIEDVMNVKETDSEVVIIDDETQETKTKRKRKISMDKSERNVDLTKRDFKKGHKKAEAKNDVKPFQYKNVNYRKFYNENDMEKARPKMKFKKHK